MSAKRFLKGERIILTRPAATTDRFVRRLEKNGAEVHVTPTIRIARPRSEARIRKAVQGLRTYDWIVFTSARAVPIFVDHVRTMLGDDRLLRRKKIAAVGPSTAAAVRKHGLLLRFVPRRFLAEALADGLDGVRGKRILLPRARVASQELPRILKERGGRVTDLAVYATELDVRPDAVFEKMASAKKIDHIIFTSPSTVRGLMAKLRSRAARKATLSVPAVVIGPVTAAAAKACGFKKIRVAATHTTAGIMRTLRKASRH